MSRIDLLRLDQRHGHGPCVLLDIDGTVADCRWRHHLLHDDEGNIDLTAHSLACGDDEPVEGVIALVRVLAQTHCVVACSGRWDVARAETEVWLDLHDVPYDHLELRPTDDHSSNGEYKVDAARRLQAEGHRFVLAIEDYPKAAMALSGVGIPTLLVASHAGYSDSQIELSPALKAEVREGYS